MILACDCGEDHEVIPAVADLIRELGTHIQVTLRGTPVVPARTWRVPRVWIAVHGLKGPFLPDLAARYGWEDVSQSGTAIP